MTRTGQTLLVVAVAAVLLGSVVWMRRPHGQSSVSDETLRQVIDMTGREVRVPRQPAHILSLATTATDTLLSLGLKERLTAIDQYSRVVPGAENLPVVGKAGALAREQVMALKIDLAFLWWYQDDAAAALEGMEIPVVRLRSGRAKDLSQTIRLIGDVAGAHAAAEPIAARLDAYLARAASPRAGSLRAFIELYGPLNTAGKGTFVNDVLQLAGLRNVADATQGDFVFSAEQLLQADPDIILHLGNASATAAFATRAGMTDLRAVQQKRILALDRYWFVAGPHFPESVEKIRNAVAQSQNLTP